MPFDDYSKTAREHAADKVDYDQLPITCAALGAFAADEDADRLEPADGKCPNGPAAMLPV